MPTLDDKAVGALSKLVVSAVRQVLSAYPLPVLYDGTLLRPLVISEMLTNSFSAVRNVTEIWGKTVDAGRYADASAYSGNCYRIALDGFALEEYATVGFKVSAANAASPSLQINALTACPIVDDEGVPLGAGVLLAGKSYVVKCRRGQFVFLGQFQIHAIAMEILKNITE